MTAQSAGKAGPQRCGRMYQACWKGAPPHIVSPFSSDLACPRPEDMRWGLSSAMQRPEDGSGLWGCEALPADGVEQAHSGECQLHTALCGLSVLVLSCLPQSHPLGSLSLGGPPLPVGLPQAYSPPQVRGW